MKVSVVIPVYNVKPYLERCVNSVLGQTHKDLEIILVDDGSTDGSGELCDQIAASDLRICVIHQKNQGLSAARNTGIRHSSGQYLAFVDSDDLWLYDNGLNMLLSQGSATEDLIIFKNIDVWKNGKQTKSRDYDINAFSRMGDAKEIFAYLVQTQQFRMSACFLLVRRQLLVDYDIFFPIGYISEDVQWSLHLWQHVCSVKFTNLELYAYYHRADSLSTTPTIWVYECYDKMFSYWKTECENGCVNAQSIRIYLAEMWVNRGYNYYLLPNNEKLEALQILKRHADFLLYAATPKTKRVAMLVRLLGVRNTAVILGVYWCVRSIFK